MKHTLTDGRIFNWKVNIIERFVPSGDYPTENNGMIKIPLYISKALGGPWHDWWRTDQIVEQLRELSDEELKACLFHQPLIAELVAFVLEERV